MRKIKKVILVLIILLAPVFNLTYAEDALSVNLTIRDGNEIIFENSVLLQPAGTIELNGHPLDAQSVLSVLNDADIASDNFSITDLQYFDSFSSFYLKCINDKCDDWQYVVNDSSPGIGMDQKILSGGENIYVYFSPQHKIILSSDSITTSESVTVRAQNYAYQDNSWEPLSGVTIGLTQANPEDPFSPIEIQTLEVDDNGQAIFSSIPEGTYNVGIKEDFYFPTEILTVIVPATPSPEPEPSSGNSNGGGSSGSKRKEKEPSQEETGEVLGASTKAVFDIDKAISFLLSQQKDNGSFGEDIYTDWAAISLLSQEDRVQEVAPIIKLVKYFSESKPAGNLLTDYERRAMALMALGLNPYNIYPSSGVANGENYITKIVNSFDGKQFGDINEDNDDIFALVVLLNAGYTKDDSMISKSLDFVLNRQKPNGSWDESVDMTGAGIQAITNIADKSCFISGSLSPLASGALPLGSSACETPRNKELLSAISKAKEFLKQSQKEDGGWGNVSSTAWAMGGILAIGEKPEDWKKNEKTPLDYLALNQETDGGIKNEYIQNRIWETAYTLTALSGKTWVEIMQKFEKPKQELAVQPIKNTVVKKITKKSPPKIEVVKKVEDSNIQNTATALKAKDSLPTLNNKEPKKQSWIKTILGKLFNFF